MRSEDGPIVPLTGLFDSDAQNPQPQIAND